MNASKKNYSKLTVTLILVIIMGVSVFVIITLIENSRGHKLIKEYVENESTEELKAIDFIIYGFDVTDDGFVFEPTNNTIVKYIGDETNVVVPARINGTKVKVICENAFRNKNIETLEIPTTVKEINYEDFKDDNITSVVIVDSDEPIFVRINNKLDELETQINDNVVVQSGDIRDRDYERHRQYRFKRQIRNIINILK